MNEAHAWGRYSACPRCQGPVTSGVRRADGEWYHQGCSLLHVVQERRETAEDYAARLAHLEREVAILKGKQVRESA